MTETELRKTIIAKCREFGLYYYHNDSWKTGHMAGFPDLVIIRHGLLFRELKADDAIVPRKQSAVGRLIRAAGSDWAIWRPADWESGRIQRELRELADCPTLADLA